jgi:hypothetical protein
VAGLTDLELAVDPSRWRRLGFRVEGAATRLGGVALRFVTARRAAGAGVQLAFLTPRR